jgi:hypothetical protein
MGHRAKTDITGAKPTQPRRDDILPKPGEDAMSTMGGANTGHSSEDEEANPLEKLRHTTMMTSIEITSSPTRHIFILYFLRSEIRARLVACKESNQGLGSRKPVDWIPSPSLRCVPHAAQSTSGAGPGETSESSISLEPPSSQAISRTWRTCGCRQRR